LYSKLSHRVVVVVVVHEKTRQEIKSPILLKLGTNVGFGEQMIMAKIRSKYFIPSKLGADHLQKRPFVVNLCIFN